jgi:hypothetical protein
MVGTCLMRGIAAVAREWRLVGLLWILGAILAAVTAVPAFIWWRRLVAYAPEADAMLQGLRLATLGELMSGEHAAGWTVLFLAAVAVTILARVGSAFLMGGMVEALTRSASPDQPVALAEAAATPATPAGGPVDSTPLAESIPAETPLSTWADDGAPVVDVPRQAVVRSRPRDDRPLMHRFFRGAGRFFLRNLVVLIVNAIATVIVAGAVFWASRAMTAPWEDTLSVSLAWMRLVLPVGLAGLVVVVFLIIYDYTCIRVLLEDSRRPVRTWLSAVRFVARRAPGALSLWLVPGLALAVAAAAYLGCRGLVPAVSGATIALMVVMQQAFMLVRAALRLVTVAAEVEYAAERRFTVARFELGSTQP